MRPRLRMLACAPARVRADVDSVAEHVWVA
jgi:hypothetical protein